MSKRRHQRRQIRQLERSDRAQENGRRVVQDMNADRRDDVLRDAVARGSYRASPWDDA